MSICEDRSKAPCRGFSKGWPLKCFKSCSQKLRESNFIFLRKTAIERLRERRAKVSRKIFFFPRRMAVLFRKNIDQSSCDHRLELSSLEASTSASSCPETGPWDCRAGMRNAINTKTNGFTRLRPLKAGGSLLDHIFSMAGFSKLSMWRKSTQPSSPWVDPWKVRSQ